MQNTIADTEVIMKDGTTALAKDVLDTLISSEVMNTIANVAHDYDLKKINNINTLSVMIVDYLQISTGIKVDPNRVKTEFKKHIRLR